MMLVTTTTTVARATPGLLASAGTLLRAEGAAFPMAQGEQAAQAELHWYAAYTCAQHEKRVSEQLAARAIEHFLPLYSSVRRWKDRRVRLELPLFPGYVFVRLALCDRLRVLQVPSVVHLVGFGGLPAALPDEEMEILRSGLSQRLRMEPHPYLTRGRRVRIKDGPLRGLDGVLVRRHGSLHAVLSIDLMMRSIIVDVDIADLDLSGSQNT
jgi:transcription antitermination factor NusG